MKEVFKNLNGYENLYQISNLGNVKSIKRPTHILLKFRDNGKGYNVSALFLKGVRKNIKTHRLVAFNFIPNPQNKPQINHINGIKSDNRVVNLEWCTQSENSIHSFENGLQKRKLTNKNVEYIRINKNKLTQKQLGLKFNVCQQMISSILNNKRRF